MRGDPVCDLDAARGNADDADAGEIGVALDDLVRDAPEGAVNGLSVQDEAGVGEGGGVRVGSLGSFAASQDRVKGRDRSLGIS